MGHRVYRAQVKDVKWLAGDTCLLRFTPQTAFDYEPGQFISLQVPDKNDPSNLLWRAYSLSLPQEAAKRDGYELCIKRLPGGHAGAYLETLKKGDWISIRAAYGEFTLRTKPGRGVCLIGTGTGVAPLRSIALSREFAGADLLFGLAIVGFRTYAEVPYAGDFERVGLATTYAISGHPEKLEFPFYTGRVTDVLKRMKSDFPWRETDFYLCGSGAMIRDVIRYLKSVHGVLESAIIAEAFEPALVGSGHITHSIPKAVIEATSPVPVEERGTIDGNPEERRTVIRPSPEKLAPVPPPVPTGISPPAFKPKKAA